MYTFLFSLFLRPVTQRDSRGRFLPGNKYRFERTMVNVAGQPCAFMAQDPMVGNYFKAVASPLAVR